MNNAQFNILVFTQQMRLMTVNPLATRSSAIAEGLRDARCACQ